MKLSDIEGIFKEVNIPKNEILFLHVKLKGIADQIPYPNLSKQIIAVLDDLYQPKTILIPTFTYSYTKSGIFNKLSSNSEVGRFGEEIRNQFDPVHRTSNPVFNVIDTNRYFEKFELKEESAFGEDSLMHLLHNLGHVVININVDEFISTYLHFLEYHYKVPYRYNKNFPGEVILSDEDKKEINYQYHVRDLDKHTSWDRHKIKTTLHKEGGLKIHQSGNVEVVWSHSKTMEKILGQKLEADKNFLLSYKL
ncbi:AAC(3) family N-acetyltransferase [Zunongwangia sp. F260]|uniref:Aminoglycoside N(3)-acetyltransferase n=1 Tax=Autumnicola lenta TaxID=3075593 RepID=A0ABU3CIY1_9FLAO|nr:AAC(3) family N-acetyltransferase [Zunongwangia sp. F260]MDT0645910.1 AAC(3) family N-acetyltransferase [Zunongwangia sp. F260]